MYVRATVAEGEQTNAILAPQQGVSRNAKGEATALVVSKDGLVEPRVLQTNRTLGNNWLVTAGLNAGEQLIGEGLQKIRPGVPVQVVPAKLAPAQAVTPEQSGTAAAPAAATAAAKAE